MLVLSAAMGHEKEPAGARRQVLKNALSKGQRSSPSEAKHRNGTLSSGEKSD
jgi:hypothetical protein